MLVCNHSVVPCPRCQGTCLTLPKEGIRAVGSKAYPFFERSLRYVVKALAGKIAPINCLGGVPVYLLNVKCPVLPHRALSKMYADLCGWQARVLAPAG